MTRAAVASLVKKKSGICLDLSWGGTPQERSVRLGPGGDIDRSPLVIPFPLPKECVHTAVVTHVLDYLPPEHWFAWWDELWRVMQPLGMVHLSGPYGGDESAGWVSDPTHVTRVTEQTFAWLDPRVPFYKLHKDLGRETPRPWHTMGVSRVPGAHGTVSYNCSMLKVMPE